MAVARRRHCPAVRLDEMLDDRQAKPEALRTARILLLESLEDLGKELGSDPLARVRDDDPDALVPTLEAHGDRPSLGCELDRVREQVRENLPEATGIAVHRADAVVHVELERE